MIRLLSCLVLPWLLLASAPVVAQDQAYDNVVIVLDASGSMDAQFANSQISRMQAAKQALHQVLAQLPDTTHVGLLVFSGARIPDPWVYPLGPLDLDMLKTALLPVQPDGGTPLGDYIKQGADRLLQERKAQHGYGSYRLLVVTDGEASDQDLVDTYTPDVISRGLTLDVIGVDMQADHTLERSAHSYQGAADPQALVRAVGQVFAEVSFSDGDAAGRDAFGFLDGLPDPFAMALLRYLSEDYGNHPIGDRPGR